MNAPGSYGTETASLLAPVECRCLLEVQASSSRDANGLYVLQLLERRAAVSADQSRIAAEAKEAQAHRLYRAGGAESRRQALVVYRDALEAFRQLGDPAKQADVFFRVGRTLMRLGDYQDALSALESAYQIFLESADPLGQANALNQMGRVRRRLGEKEQARQHFEQALSLWTRYGLPAQQAIAASNLGALAQDEGDYLSALDSFLAASEAFRQAGDTDNLASILSNLGHVGQAVGEPSLALERLEKALALCPEDSIQRAFALNNLGWVHSRSGDRHLALRLYAEALSIAAKHEHRDLQALLLGNLGKLELQLGQPEKALPRFEQAVSFGRFSDQRRLAIYHNDAGAARLELGLNEDALESFQTALRISRNGEFRTEEADALRRIAQVHLLLGDPKKSFEAAQQSLLIYQQMGLRLEESSARILVGKSRADLGDLQGAITELDASLELSRSLVLPSEEAAALTAKARIRMAQRRFDEALRLLESAMESVESLRAQIYDDHLRSSFFASWQESYQLYVDLLMRLHRQQSEAGWERRAFDAAERFRARSLIDLLREAQVSVGTEGDQQLRSQRIGLRRRLIAADERRLHSLSSKSGSEKAQRMLRQADQLFEEYSLLEARLSDRSPKYAALKVSGSFPTGILKQLQERELDDETLLLEYFLAPQRSYLWAVTRDRVETFELPGQEQLGALGREAHEFLSRLDPNRRANRQRAVLTELSRVLLGPVAHRLKGRRLAIVADGALHFVPFAALPLPGSLTESQQSLYVTPLIASHEVISLPSASSLSELSQSRRRRPPSARELAVIADPVFGHDDPRLGSAKDESPDLPLPEEANLYRRLSERLRSGLIRLPWSRLEAEAIAAEAGLSRTLVALDFEADISTALSDELAKSRIIHFATHGLLDTRNPGLSALALSLVDAQGRPRPGFLRLKDIFSLSLSSDLVVLSGCQTALGKHVDGEGLLGMTRGFFYAGAPQVMASLWPIRDRATAELSRRFYQGIFKGGLRPAAALRQAQLSMRRERRWQDPFYWAAFTIQGDWRQWASPGPR